MSKPRKVARATKSIRYVRGPDGRLMEVRSDDGSVYRPDASGRMREILPAGRPTVVHPPVQGTAVTDLRVYLSRTGGLRVALAELRAQFPHYTRETVNSVLRGMAARREIALYAIEHGRERTLEDDEAALVVAGVPHHRVRWIL